MQIESIHAPEEKSAICLRILHALPAWFGIEESIVEYGEKVREDPFFVAREAGQLIGFLALCPHTEAAAEMRVLGVLPEYHRKGAGKALVERCEAYCREKGYAFLTVKTLAASAKSEEYARTRRFYAALGFHALEVFPEYWDAANPCLLMAKYIGE